MALKIKLFIHSLHSEQRKYFAMTAISRPTDGTRIPVWVVMVNFDNGAMDLRNDIPGCLQTSYVERGSMKYVPPSLAVFAASWKEMRSRHSWEAKQKIHGLLVNEKLTAEERYTHILCYLFRMYAKQRNIRYSTLRASEQKRFLWVTYVFTECTKTQVRTLDCIKKNALENISWFNLTRPDTIYGSN